MKLISILLCLIANIAVAQPDSLLTSQNSKLFFPAAALTTNGVTGLTNHAPHLMVSAVSTVSAQGGSVSLINTQVWVRMYNGQFNDWGNKVVLDREGNVYVSGDSAGVGVGNDLALVKYSSDGTPLWTNRYDGPAHSNDWGWTAAVDGAGGIYVTGQSQNSNGGRDIVTLKYSSDGTAIWTNRYNRTGVGAHDLKEFKVDDDGNAHVLIHTGDGDFATLKYDALGTALWTNYFKLSSNSTDAAAAIALGPNDEVFVVGTSWGTPLGQGASTLKIAPNGVTVWTNFFNLTPYGYIQSTAIVVDKSGNPTIAGYRSFPQKDYVQVKFDNDGTPLWTNFLAGSICACGPWTPQLNQDLFDNLIVFGVSPGAGGGEPDFSIVKLASDGLLLWTNRYYEPDSADQGFRVSSTLDNAGNLYLAAQITVPTNTSVNYSTVKIDANGTAVWTNRFDAPNHGYDTPMSVAVDDAGAVYVTGVSSDDYATLKYSDYVSYTPPLDFTGTDNFVFVVVDNTGNAATNIVTVVVQSSGLRFNTASPNFFFDAEGLHLKVDGTQGSDPVILYASPDLLVWQSISTNAPLAGSAVFVDDTATAVPKRFYRAVQRQ